MGTLKLKNLSNISEFTQMVNGRTRTQAPTHSGTQEEHGSVTYSAPDCDLLLHSSYESLSVHPEYLSKLGSPGTIDICCIFPYKETKVQIEIFTSYFWERSED
jgi:hypothetical protein